MSTKKTTQWKRVIAKPRWSQAEARSVVAAWRASGLRMHAFSRTHNLGDWRLRYWVPIVEASPSPKLHKPDEPSSPHVKFVPAIITGAVSSLPEVVIRFPDGVAVELRDAQAVRVESLRQLVASMREEQS